MAIHVIFKSTIWESQRSHIDFLYSKRKGLKSRPDRIGINTSIIINSACFLEGAMEYHAKELLENRLAVLRNHTDSDFVLRRTKNVFLNSIEKEFESRISRTTGLEQFASLFDLLSVDVKNLSLKRFKQWEGITVLFQLRNVLAHGREITAKRTQSYLTNNEWEEQFLGGYSKAEKYLLKKNLIKNKYTENESANHLFTNKVADHFHTNAKQFLKLIEKTMESECVKLSE